MNTLKYFISLAFIISVVAGCKKEMFNDVSFVSGAAASDKLSLMFDITQDNSGLVTITPNGEGAISYDVYYGDATTAPVKVDAGKSTKHIYAEGEYSVKVVGYNITGKQTEATQSLTVSFKAPENLKVKLDINSLTVNISASAKYETLFKVFYGDSNNVSPIPSTSFLEGQTVTHTYANAGTYIVRVLALSGGAATTEFLDTIKVAKQIDLPVTFEDSKVDYTTIDFGGNQSSLANDPVNADNKVMKAIKTSGAEVWAGTTIGTSLGFATPIAITAGSTKMSVKVYSPAAGLDVKLKIEDHTNGGNSVETDVLTTKANQWETLTFDFSKQSPGTAPVNYSYKYDKASIFFDFGKNGSGSTFYFDDLMLLPPALAQIALPVTFENSSVDYSVIDFGGASTADATDPANAANHVKKTIKGNGAEVWAGTTLGTGSGFASPIPVTANSSKMTVRVYAPAAGIDVKLKIEDHTNGGHSVETDVLTTVANQWETLVFDFSKPSAGTQAWNAAYTYDVASVFFDFGTNGSGKTFYWDDVQMVQQINLPVTFDDAAFDYSLTDFGNNQSVITTDPVNSANMVVKTVKPNGAEVWAGTTIGTPSGFATAIPITATATKMTVRVYSPAAGLDIKLKIEDHTNGGNSVETDVLTTVANQWETLTFDFSNPSPGTPAWSAAKTYDKASIFFDFGTPGNGKIFYWDDVKIQ